ncbi:MAG: NAD-dependent epimerase/dehydratase family protein [Thermodesulfobacteriota bacterium]
MKTSDICLVTGAAGFMGSHVVEELVRTGARVIATSRPRRDTSFFDALGVRYIPADLTRPDTLIPLFAEKVERVFHLGAVCNFSTPYAKLHPTNVAGVDCLTDLARQHAVGCFVHVTSTSVYGYYQGTPFTEESPRSPMDDYGRSKRDGEDIVFRKMQLGLPAIVVRPCTVYGPRCNDGAGKVFSRPGAIKAIPGSGNQKLSNIRAEDVAAAVVYLSEREDARGRVYNLADDSHPTVGEALRTAALTFGTPVPSLHLPLWLVRFVARLEGLVCRFRNRIPELEYDAARYLAADYIVDNSRLKQTGFRFRYPDFAASMEQLGAAFRSDRPSKP